MVNPTHIKRLAFIKYVYTLGIEQSYQPVPSSSVSLLLFHDSIELFLQLASEIFDVGKSKVEFMAYWDLLSKEISDETLPQKEAMRRLNKARVSLKHSGTRPSEIDIESFLFSSTSFFFFSVPLFFFL